MIYLKYNENNKSTTVLLHFCEAVKNFGKPSRVCDDHSKENRKVAKWIIRENGLNRRSYISGQSVHNQRIEHL